MRVATYCITGLNLGYRTMIIEWIVIRQEKVKKLSQTKEVWVFYGVEYLLDYPEYNHAELFWSLNASYNSHIRVDFWSIKGLFLLLFHWLILGKFVILVCLFPA